MAASHQEVAQIINDYRVIPRLLLLFFGLVLLNSMLWYMELEVRTMQDSGFVSIVAAAFAKLSDWYMKTGGVKT